MIPLMWLVENTSWCNLVFSSSPTTNSIFNCWWLTQLFHPHCIALAFILTSSTLSHAIYSTHLHFLIRKFISTIKLTSFVLFYHHQWHLRRHVSPSLQPEWHNHQAGRRGGQLLHHRSRRGRGRPYFGSAQRILRLFESNEIFDFLFKNIS